MEFIREIFVKRAQIDVAVARRTIVLKAEASLSQAEWQGARTAVQENVSCKEVSAVQCEPRDPDTDPGALARCRTACSTAAEKCALQRSVQQSSAAAATCSTEKEERARDLLQTFPRAAAWFPKRGAHTPEPLAAAAAAGCSRARCARTAEQSAEPGGCTSGAEQQQQGRAAAAAAALIQPVSQP